MVTRIVAGALLVSAFAYPAAASESSIEWLLRIFGVGGIRTFVGYLPCAGEKVFPACLANGTHFVTISNLSDIECQAYLSSAQAAGGSGGACL